MTADVSGIRPNSFQAWMAAIRPKTFGIALSPVIVGMAAAISETGRFQVLIGILTALVAVLAQGLSNMENDAGYTRRKAENGKRKGLPRATSMGWLTVRQVEFAVLLAAVLLVAVSLGLAALTDWVILALGVLSAAAAYLYMGGPKPIAYSPWGEFMVFVFFGLVAVNGTYYLQTGTVSVISVLASAACGSIAACVLLVNNWRDAEHDESVGRRTLAVVLGKKRFPRLYLNLMVLPFLLVLVIATVYPQHSAYLLSLLPLRKVKGLYDDFRSRQGTELNATMFGTVKLEVEFSFLLAAGALIDALWHYAF